MSPAIACITRALSLLMLFFMSHDTYAQNIDTSQKELEGNYYNLKGEKLSLPGRPGSKKMFVITTRPGETKPSRLQAAIRQHMVIDVPSEAVLDSMDKAFDRANRHHGKEQLFYVGRKGNISIIVEGNNDSVGSADNKPARKDLAEVKGDEPAYDVHTHADSLSAGDGTDFASPSPGDTDNANFRDRQQASVILAYEPEIYHEAGIPLRQGIDLPPSIRNARRITFYYQQINPIKISYSDFIKAVQKITGTDQTAADHPHLPYHTR